MDMEALSSQLPELRKEAARLREQENTARQKAENIERIIEGIEGLGAPSRATEMPAEVSAPQPTLAELNGSGPRGIAAVRRVVLEGRERVWKARDVHAVLEQRGWLSSGAKHPLRGTEAAINRLVHRGELERTRPGRYRATDRMKEDEV